MNKNSIIGALCAIATALSVAIVACPNQQAASPNACRTATTCDDFTTNSGCTNVGNIGWAYYVVPAFPTGNETQSNYYTISSNVHCSIATYCTWSDGSCGNAPGGTNGHTWSNALEYFTFSCAPGGS
jgi:hypothetical protein